MEIAPLSTRKKSFKPWSYWNSYALGTLPQKQKGNHMLKVLFISLFSLTAFNASATVDGMTSAWIVVQDIQDEENFSIQQVPVIGCYGLSQGPQLVQFTAEHNVKSTMGCGDSDTSVTNINALSCAKVVSSEESNDYSSFKKIVLDVSNCSYKNNKKFITMVRTAAKRNFPQTAKGQVVKSKEVELVIIK
jgi:hypothetical protein